MMPRVDLSLPVPDDPTSGDIDLVCELAASEIRRAIESRWCKRCARDRTQGLEGRIVRHGAEPCPLAAAE